MARIAIILGRLVVGGIAPTAIDEANFLQKHHQVLLISGEPDLGEASANFQLHYLSPSIQHISIKGFQRTWRWWKHIATYFELKRILGAFNPDIVHTHTPVAGIAGRLSAWRLGVPCIVHTYHGFLFEGYYSWWKSQLVVIIERWLAAKTQLLLVLSEGQKSMLVNQYKVAPLDQIMVVPVGIDISKFSGEVQLQRDQFRRHYLLDDAELAIAIVGRLVSVKNHSYLLEAISEVKNSLPSVRLFIVGDGPLQKDLMKQCQRLKLDSTVFPEHPVKATVTFTSWLNEIPLVMAGVEVVALSSKNEGIPLALMEAMAAGKAVVSTAVGGVPEMIEDGKDGLLVPQNKPKEFASAIFRLADPHIRECLGANAKQKATKQFARQQVLVKIAEIIDNCRKSHT